MLLYKRAKLLITIYLGMTKKVVLCVTTIAPKQNWLAKKSRLSSVVGQISKTYHTQQKLVNDSKNLIVLAFLYTDTDKKQPNKEL